MKSEAEKQAEAILGAYNRSKKKEAEMVALLKAAVTELPYSEGIIIITLGCDGVSRLTATIDNRRVVAEFEAIKHNIFRNEIQVEENAR